MLTQSDIGRMLGKHIVSVDFHKPGRGRYRTAKPLTAQLIGDGMLRLYTNDGVSHTMRPWYEKVTLGFDDGIVEDIIVEPQVLSVGCPGVSLIPYGVRRVLATSLDVYDAQGPMWFHYGPLLGMSEHEDLAEGLSDSLEYYTWVTSHELVYWWRDEPVEQYFD